LCESVARSAGKSTAARGCGAWCRQGTAVRGPWRVAQPERGCARQWRAVRLIGTVVRGCGAWRTQGHGCARLRRRAHARARRWRPPLAILLPRFRTRKAVRSNRRIILEADAPRGTGGGGQPQCGGTRSREPPEADQDAGGVARTTSGHASTWRARPRRRAATLHPRPCGLPGRPVRSCRAQRCSWSRACSSRRNRVCLCGLPRPVTAMPRRILEPSNLFQAPEQVPLSQFRARICFDD
jgi:hypothetical protein